MQPSLFQGNVVNSNRILYTPSDFAKNNLIHLQEIGKLHAIQPHTSSRSGLVSYLFFIVTEGSGSLTYAGSTYELHKGSCVFIDCQIPYSHCSSNDLWTLKWAHFYGPTMNGIYRKYMERGGRPCFETSYIREYDHILDTLYEIAASESYIKDMKINEQFASILSLLMEESWSTAKSDHKNPAGKRSLQDVKEYIDMHFSERITLDDLTGRFFINKYYLTRIFKEQFGLSVNNYILQQRITHAKHLLRFSELSIEEIGIRCGIQDPNYFSRIFKKVEGITPGEYRKQW